MKTTVKSHKVYQLIKNISDIDLNPDFQREKVWTLKKQQYFLDTVLKGWGTPKMYLAVVDKNKGKYICVDGKQRISSLFLFSKNKIKLNSEYSSYGNKSYGELPKSIREKIDEYCISVEEISSFTTEELAELFKRLQSGMVLNSGENLMAVTSELKDKVKSFSGHMFFKNKVSLKNKRYTYFVICAQLTCLEINGISNLGSKNIEILFKKYKKIDSGDLLIRTKLKKIKFVLDVMDNIFSDDCPYFSNRATVVSFYLLISEFIDRGGDISFFETKFSKFFAGFIKDLKTEISKGDKSTDPQLINYQSAVIQGADKQKAIALRNNILKERLVKFDVSFFEFFKESGDSKIIFNNLYGLFEDKFENSGAVDKFIFSKKPKLKKYNCRPGYPAESLPTHIRHCIHHKAHGKFDSKDLQRAYKILRNLEKYII